MRLKRTERHRPARFPNAATPPGIEPVYSRYVEGTTPRSTYVGRFRATMENRDQDGSVGYRYHTPLSFSPLAKDESSGLPLSHLARWFLKCVRYIKLCACLALKESGMKLSWKGLNVQQTVIDSWRVDVHNNVGMFSGCLRRTDMSPPWTRNIDRRPRLTKLNTMSAYTCQKASSIYRNLIRLEKASQKQSSDTHKTPCDRVKWCRERKKKKKKKKKTHRARQRRRIHAKQIAVSPTYPLPIFSTTSSDSSFQLIVTEDEPAAGCSNRLFVHRGCGGVVVRLPASHQSEPGSIPGPAAPGFSHVGSCRGCLASPAQAFRPRSTLTPLHRNRLPRSKLTSTVWRQVFKADEDAPDCRLRGRGGGMLLPVWSTPDSAVNRLNGSDDN
ncbi:hypothetical protein PR048_004829 [Dryococelus australis]|uniref:Uncharacterized protein n=1 Tax=Dryococelus australis TaxID=614101 RepID=A0ABQ9I6I0_9NEOP|nr:hypothetical protein PR048_004829 [Dryococelus australis]